MKILQLFAFILIQQAVIAQGTPLLKWKFSAAAAVIGSPVADNDAVYFGSTNGVLYAVLKTGGTLKWKFTTNGPIRSTPCIEKEKLFLVSGDGNLYCINKNSGKAIWTFGTMTGFIGDTQHDFADYYQSSPVYYNNVIYFGSGDGNIYAVNAGDGSLLWKYATAGNVHTTPALYKDKLFIGSYDGYLYALNNQSGMLLWKFKSAGQEYFPKGEMMGNPVVSNGLVFAGSRDFNFYAIDINGGYCHWLKQFPKGWALPITANDSVLYLGTSEDRALLAMDVRTGQEKWRLPVSFNIFGGCAITKSMGCFGTLLGKVYGIDLATGKTTWTFTTDGYNNNHLKYFKPDDTYRTDISSIIGSAENIVTLYNEVGAVFSTPLIDGNMVYITSADGNLYALER